MSFIDMLRRQVEVAQGFFTAANLRRLRHAVLHWQKLYIVARDVNDGDPETQAKPPLGQAAIQCEVLATARDLFAFENEFPQSFRDSLERLAGRLDHGCIVFVLRTGAASSRQKQIVGYSICQPGVFSAFGSINKSPPDIMFGHYNEFLPDYRGRQLMAVLNEKRMQYCQSHGLRRICGVISSENIASLKTSLRSGFSVVGALHRVSILKGLIVWQTSWKTIEKALQRLGAHTTI